MTCVPAIETPRVTTASVLEAIKAYVDIHSGHFTTHDIARHIGVEEYPARTAFTWLARNKFIEIVPGVRSKRYLPALTDDGRRRHADFYDVNVYQLREQAAEVDFAALNRLFGYGR